MSTTASDWPEQPYAIHALGSLFKSVEEVSRCVLLPGLTLLGGPGLNPLTLLSQAGRRTLVGAGSTWGENLLIFLA